jgi:hypothetical protein
VQISLLDMGRPGARFRLSLKDQKTGEMLKVELIDAPGYWGERRYRVRVNGRAATKVQDVTLTEVFTRLRRWLVGRAKQSEPK